jgi:hypothetical protein
MLDRKSFVASGSTPAIEFERPEGSVQKFLRINGSRAYDMGIAACDTCNFSFQRLEGANERFSVETLSERLRAGLELVPDEDDLEEIGKALPTGTYEALLLEESPVLTMPSSETDYFFHEQVDLWGMDNFFDVPHYTQVPYYRARQQRFQETNGLFEFIVPLYTKSWLDEETVAAYESRLTTNPTPTALAISVLKVRRPALKVGREESGITLHWCLAHYLLDGHHKVFAASKVNRPITLLSLLAVNECVATPAEIETVLGLL